MKKLVLLLSIVGLVSGCSGKAPESAYYVRDGVDLEYIETIAILPFGNYTGDKTIDSRIRDMTITEVLASKKFDVVDRGIVDSTLQEMALANQNSFDLPVIKVLGKRLNVKAFLAGNVNKIAGSGKSAYSYPEISLTLHLIDAESGQILWRSTSYKNGYSVVNRLFDLDPIDEFEITVDLLSEMIASIPKAANN